ncbi:hypothetical protein ABK040_002786 [Willaertia magna]
MKGSTENIFQTIFSNGYNSSIIRMIYTKFIEYYYVIDIYGMKLNYFSNNIEFNGTYIWFIHFKKDFNYNNIYSYVPNQNIPNLEMNRIYSYLLHYT